ncbi:GlxA family transcriptional regulator [Enterobacter sp. Ap-1006]|uniref:GlxA family transcriptional regulator n=1 Tax=Enterobacter sp. Ap-1006 TaxID=2608345 RepID=UPI00141E30A1|nr:GlxA family transcriptional regulator [Enterobacter sp. Ap-1006]NIF46256.1 GlxA family transcriptional regulator [Enterobacter sp. Ap-1006]
MLTIGLVVYPGFQALGLAVGSVFEYANLYGDGPTYEVVLASEAGGLVRSSQGFVVETCALGERPFDTLIIVGDNDISPPGPTLLTYLRDVSGRVRRIASICTGAFVLAEAGLLNGKAATTHWHYAERMKRSYPTTRVEEDRIFITDGHIWTSAGMSAGIDLALALVEKDLGPEIVKLIAKKLVLYHRRGGGQSQFSTLVDMNAKSDRIQKVLTYVRANLRANLSVEALADVAGMSARQFSRVFRVETGQSPAKAIERLRVEAARIMLETTNHPVEVVAREAGFGDRERMRQSFIRAFGQPPQTIQRSSARKQPGV